MKRLAFLVLAACSCSDNPSTPIDAKVDSTMTGDGPCGGNVYFTGELVDWDSTESATGFCGVYNATFAVHGDASKMDKTSPNGRFELCIAPADRTQVDVTMDTHPSPCASAPGTYTIKGIAVADKNVIASGKLWSGRAITMERTATFATMFPPALDPAKAGVFVHVEGTPKAVSIDNSHDTALTYDGTAWSAGNTGKNVFFPNVTVAGGTANVTMGGALGEGPVPIAANTITYVTLVAP